MTPNITKKVKILHELYTVSTCFVFRLVVSFLEMTMTNYTGVIRLPTVTAYGNQPPFLHECIARKLMSAATVAKRNAAASCRHLVRLNSNKVNSVIKLLYIFYFTITTDYCVHDNKSATPTKTVGPQRLWRP